MVWDKVDKETLFWVSQSTRARGHPMKLKPEIIRTKGFFF